MKISIIGTGYVGLVSGSCLADKGHTVTCVDVDEEKIKKLKNLEIPIYEEGLDQIIASNLNKNLYFTSNLSKSILETDLSIVAVGTPFDGKKIDLKYIREISTEIGKILKNKKKYHVVIIKSTVIPTTTDDVVTPILEKFSGKKVIDDFGVGMNPEFLREGSAVLDFMSPDRIVLGSSDKKALLKMKKVFSTFKNVPILEVNNKTAEMIKYVNNSFLASVISFSNEIGNLCAKIDNIDAIDVMKGVTMDHRISPMTKNGDRIFTGLVTYMSPGCGYGGSCFPKDTNALVSFGKEKDQLMPLLNSVININKDQNKEIINRLNKHYKELKNLKVSVLGLSFKPGTDDMRHSPSIPIINYLIDNEALVSAYDPIVKENAMKIFNSSLVSYKDTIDEAIIDSKVVILLNSSQEFNKIHNIFNKYKKSPVVIDGRRFLDKNKFQNYEGVGIK